MATSRSDMLVRCAWAALLLLALDVNISMSCYAVTTLANRLWPAPTAQRVESATTPVMRLVCPPGQVVNAVVVNAEGTPTPDGDRWQAWCEEWPSK